MTRFVTLLLFVCHQLNGQTEQKEINEQIWKPFIKTFSEFDTEGFMALHSKDLVRSSRDEPSILNWTQYYNATRDSELRSKMSNRNRTIALRFLERISSANQSIETGIYKTSNVLSNGTTRDFYGKFLVVLRKENGVWKILVDTDSSEGGTIEEKSFLSAKVMDQ